MITAKRKSNEYPTTLEKRCFSGLSTISPYLNFSFKRSL